MARAQDMADQVQSLSTKVHELETALAQAHARLKESEAVGTADNTAAQDAWEADFEHKAGPAQPMGPGTCSSRNQGPSCSEVR